MADRKEYRVKQIDGKITFQVEELWDGGTVKGPYGTKEAAVAAEERCAEENGFLDQLVMAGAIEEKVNPATAFEQAENGVWTCTQACSIEIDKKEITFNEGLTFTKGTPFMGVDVAEWLESNIKT